MRVRVLGFASAGDALGASEVVAELPEGSTVADLRLLFEPRYPALAPLWPRLAIALDGVLVESSAVLSDGAEVALLPPVSGGAGTASGVSLTEDPIDATAAMALVAAPGAGAQLLFLGTVRDHAKPLPGLPPRTVLDLTYSAYRPMALERLARIAFDLEAVPSVRVAIIHRLGTVAVGEPSVAIAVSAPHRAAAYEASRTALERLKAEVPIWKKERYADGHSVWREEEPLCKAEGSSASGRGGRG